MVNQHPATSDLLSKALSLHRSGNFDEAEIVYKTLLSSEPQHPQALSLLGTIYAQRDKLEEGIQLFERAIAAKPDNEEAYFNRALALQKLGKYREALVDYGKAFAIDPSFYQAGWHKSMIHLTLGEYEEGWKLYELRWKANEHENRVLNKPLWLGKESLAGKTILLHAEQGLGDTIQFCRYASMVAALGATVILEVPPSLAGVLSTLKGNIHIITQGNVLPEYDYHTPLMSLPYAFKTTLETIPSVPYLMAQPEYTDKWRPVLNEVLGKSPHSFRIGLCWAGQARLDSPECINIDLRRSIHFSRLKPILDIPNVSFVSLQLGSPKAEINDDKVKDISVGLESWSDTAAVVSLLDLVISVDTSVCHIAAAVGKPTFMLNRYDTCWRWLLDRDDSVWYPSITQFRQKIAGDWDEVINRVKEAVTEKVANAAAS